MRMDQAAATTRLYPDLRKFYKRGVVDASTNPPSQTPPRLLPSAPPLSQSSNDLHLNEVPEEPEKDYMEDDTDDCFVDYPQEEGNTGGCTLDKAREDCSRENIELEPDYDMDDPHEDMLNNLNLTAREKKILHDKNIEMTESPRSDKDYEAWMTWRMQANKILAAVILAREGHQVYVRESEIRQKPLSRQNMQNVMKQARGPRGQTGRKSAERTSLPECPYVMYGIPRISAPRSDQH